MKVLVIAVVLFASLIAVQCADPDFKQIKDQCKKDNNVSEEECKAFQESGMDKSKATNNIKCASKCFLEKIKLLVNGELVDDNILGMVDDIPPENVKLAIDNCNKESGVDECDDAFQKGACIYEALHLKKV